MMLFAVEGVAGGRGSVGVWYMNWNRDRPPRAERVRGPSLFAKALACSEATEIRHFFLGSTDKTHKSLVSTVAARHPDLTIAGAYSPPFAPVDEGFLRACEDRIKEAHPDIVWVGLGTPKQDVVGTRLVSRIGVPFVNVGAAFDFTAGTAREAPRWMQELGLEWFFRLLNDPRRLWRRYLLGNTRFLIAATRHELQRGHK